MQKNARRIRIAITALFAIAALSLFCLVPKIIEGGGGKNEVTSQSAASSTQKKPTLKIGVDSLEPFFFMGRSGKNIGIDADLARAACKRIGVTPVFVRVPWDERDTYLADRKIDCIWSAFATNGREDCYRWTTAYLDTPLAMIVNGGNPTRSISDFHGSGGVAVRSESVAEAFFTNGAFAKLASNDAHINISSYGTTDMAETAFAKGLTDALVSYKLVLDRFIDEQASQAQYRYIDDNLTMLHLGVAFSKDSTSPYIGKLNKAIQDMKDDGTVDAIVKKYETTAAKEARDAK